MSTTSSAPAAWTEALAALALALLATAARADVLHVPGEFETITFAVEAAGPGDTVLIAAGTYPEQVVVTGAEGLRLRGQGAVELTGAPLDIGLVLDACKDTTVENLRFRGQSLGLQVTGCTGVTVRRCRAEAMDELGFQVLDSAGTLLDRCVVDGAPGAGLQLVDTLGGAVRRCSFRSVQTGLFALGAVGLEVDRLKVEDTTGAGLLFDATCTGNQVRRSRFLRTGGPGLAVNGDGDLFTRDLVLDAAGIGIELQGNAGQNVLERERVVRSGGTAFVLQGTAQEARDCRAVDAGDAGLVCAGSGQHVVQGLRVASPGSYGVLVNFGCGDCLLLDGRVAGAPENGIETAGDRTVLSGNVVSGAGVVGIQVNSGQNTLTGNRAHGSGEADLRDLEGSSTYADNHFGTQEFP